MNLFVILSSIVTYLSVCASAQRAPPGVPPQHYQPQQQQYVQQQQQHQQQYQQVPVQHVPVQQHQVPVQQHQVPVQHVPVQQQVPVQHQQVPVQQAVPVQHQQGHHHGQPNQILNTANIAHEKEHIAEHMEVPIDTSKMSEQELQFHYFKMHDADNNNKLDGCELIKSLIHWHGPEEKEPEPLSDEAIAQVVDQIVNLADKNKDGLIDYSEYRLAVYT